MILIDVHLIPDIVAQWLELHACTKDGRGLQF